MTFVANEKGRKGMEAGVTRYTKNRQSLSIHIKQIFSSTRLHAIKCFVRPDAVAYDGNAANATKLRLSFNSDSRSYEDPNLRKPYFTFQKHLSSRKEIRLNDGCPLPDAMHGDISTRIVLFYNHIYQKISAALSNSLSVWVSHIIVERIFSSSRRVEFR